MVAGIILFALGMKKTIDHVDEPLTASRRRAVRRPGAVPARPHRLPPAQRRHAEPAAPGRGDRRSLALIPVAHDIDALLGPRHRGRRLLRPHRLRSRYASGKREIVSATTRRRSWPPDDDHRLSHLPAVRGHLRPRDHARRRRRWSRVRGDAEDVFSHGFICPKGVSLKALHDDPDRAAHAAGQARRRLVRRGVVGRGVRRDRPSGCRRSWSAHGRDAVARLPRQPVGAQPRRRMLYGRVLLKALGDEEPLQRVDRRPVPQADPAAAYMFGGGARRSRCPDLDRTSTC